MDIQSKILEVILFMPGFLFSLSVHEAAHAFVADKLGDHTAKSLGRATLNPLPHMDPIGTVLLPIFGIFTGFFFGWGKPVPVISRNFSNVKRDLMLVSAAGPFSNLILAIIFSLIIRMYAQYGSHLMGFGLPFDKAQLVMDTLLGYMFLNLALCFFNLIPIHPLDGGKILSGILPGGLARSLDQITSRYGMWILIILIASRSLKYVLWPPILFVGHLLLKGI